METELPLNLIEYLNEAREPLPPLSSPDEPLRLDSLAVIRLIAFLESDLGIRVEDEDLHADNFQSLRTIARLLEPNSQGTDAS